MLISLRGTFLAAEVANGLPGKFRLIDDVVALDFDLSQEKSEHTEKRSGRDNVAGVLYKNAKATFTAECKDFSAENIARITQSTSQQIAGATVTGEALPTGLVAGDFARLANPDVSAVVITDSAATPVALVEGTHYRVAVRHGTIEIINPAAFVQPFKVDYVSAASTSIQLLNSPSKTYWLRFEGIDINNGDRPILVEFYKARFAPKGFGLINEDFATTTISGDLLYDSTKASDPVMGGFGRYVQLAN